MQNLKVLNSREIKKITAVLKEQYGFDKKLEYAYFLNEKKNKLYLINRAIAQIEMEKIRVNSLGLYFGEIKEGEGIRLSIEGSQMIGLEAKKNVLELRDTQAKRWLKGEDIGFGGETDGFVILKSGDDFIGCAKHKNNILLNHVPKERRIRCVD